MFKEFDMDSWKALAETLGDLGSAALLVIVVVAFLWFFKNEKRKNGANARTTGDGDEAVSPVCQAGECPNQDKIDDLHKARLRDRTPFMAATDDAAADAAIHKTHAHGRIQSRETKHTRKLQAETARAAGVTDAKIKQIERDIDNDLTGEFEAIENGDPPSSPPVPPENP